MTNQKSKVTIYLVLIACLFITLKTSNAEERHNERYSTTIPLINFDVNKKYKEKVFLATLEMIYFNTTPLLKIKDHYYSWCCADLGIGPQKGRDKPVEIFNIPGFKLVFPKNEIINKDPGLQLLQKNIEDLNEVIQLTIPVINDANRYYKDESYKIDNYEGGREIHLKLHPLLGNLKKAFNKSAETILANLDAFKDSFLTEIFKTYNEADVAYYSTSLLYYELILKEMLSRKKPEIDDLKKELNNSFLELSVVIDEITIEGSSKILDHIRSHLKYAE